MQTVDGKLLIPFMTPAQMNDGDILSFCACVHKIQKMSGFAFVLLRTGRYVFQAIYTEECETDIGIISEGCYISVTGRVRADRRARYGYEIVLHRLTCLSVPAEEYPLRVSAKKLGCSLETNLQYRSAALRNPHERAILKLAEGVCAGFREFMLKHDFTEIHTPKIVSTGAEGGANIFKLDYFGNPAFLAQSPQFYKQTCVTFFDRVFEIDPVYRAEKHNSVRHLNEYTGLDFEMAYIHNMTDIMQMETAMLRYVMQYLREHYHHELVLLEVRLPVIDHVPVLTFFEVLDILGKPHAQADLDPSDEIQICEFVKKTYQSELVYVTHFPSAKRPFYTMDNARDPKLAESFDLLMRGLEITTGGQRIHDYTQQVEKILRHGLDPSAFDSYLAVHKNGMPPHGGLGIGLERLVMKLVDLSNIRQASLFPRDITHLKP